jgi:tryptophanyl-tRNA synthetase
MASDFKVTPWEVSGEIDYSRLVKEFGTEEITEELLKRFEKVSKKPLHFMLRRQIFFSHRDLGKVLSEYEAGRPFYLYTGRGPSGHTHVGHLVPWVFTRYLQEAFGTDLFFQMTDDEKFLFNEKLNLETTHKFAQENALDLIALGFEEGKTHIMSDLDCIHKLYPKALEVAKRVTFSTAKSVFGFTNETNIGSIFFTAVQSAPCFLGKEFPGGKKQLCLIPYAIDQDPHFRVTRDVTEKLGYPKPAGIQSKFIPSLQGFGKMSASDPQSSIFTTDSPEEAEKKIMRAFTGGRATAAEQRKLGGNPEIDCVIAYLTFFFEEDDKKLQERIIAYRKGDILDGENKAYLAEKVKAFLKEHQRKRESARKRLDEFMVKD